MHQITHAMELVASAKMKKSQDAVLGTRPFATQSWDLLNRLIPKLEVKHQLLESRSEVKKITLAIISSDRGLCGSFNLNVVRQTTEAIRTIKTDYPTAQIELVTMGRKARDVMRKTNYELVADFPKPDRTVVINDLKPLRSLLVQRFLEGSTDRVVLVYTDFVSGLVQRARLHVLLPFPQLNSYESLSQLSGLGNNNISTYRHVDISHDCDYIFEPSADVLAEILLPTMIDNILYQALLESTASEHAARRMAMKNATEAAGDMIDELLLEYNQRRQAGITQEIAEIATAAAVMN